MLSLVGLLFLSALLFWHFVWKRRGLPPGPVPLPLLGNILTIGRSKCAYAPYQQWAKQFGPIYTIWCGETPIVVVADFQLMRDLFVKDGDAYAGRELNDLFSVSTAMRGKLYGVVQTEGELWKVTRKFTLQKMRNLGMGRAQLEQKYLSEIGAMIGRVRQEIDSAAAKDDPSGIQLHLHIDRLVGSTINQLLFGHPFSDDHLDEFHQLKHFIDSQTMIFGSIIGAALLGMPSLRHFPPFSWAFATIDRNLSDLFAFIDKTIAKRMAKRQQMRENGAEDEEEENDLLNCFLNQMDKEGRTPPADEGDADPQQRHYFNIKNLRVVCYDLFLAGQETTSTTLSFLVLYLLLDQRVQQKMQKELDKFCTEKEEKGKIGEMMITTADRPKLPYVNAVINESQRLCNLLPLNMPHRTMADVQIDSGGATFRLGRGTIIVPQISCALFDQNVFPNPHRFLPERFLNQSGQLERYEQLIPFGLGKRICMGESLARMELFLFTANFFRNFSVLPVDPLNPPSSEKQKSFAVCPLPYRCKIEPRF